jgi:hypothetical protein
MLMVTFPRNQQSLFSGQKWIVHIRRQEGMTQEERPASQECGRGDSDSQVNGEKK